MAALGTRRGRQPPILWQILTDYWDLPAPMRQRWWRAIATSRYSEVVAFRQQLLLYSSTKLGGVKHLLHTTWGPAAVVKVLELLVLEQLLTRAEVCPIEDAVLACTGKDGRWIGFTR
jgi:hypothetical protein